MNRVTKTLGAATVALSTAMGASAPAGASEGLDSLTTVLRSYEKALVASDVDRVMKLYAEDGVFMPQHSPSQVGAEAVRAAYENVFKTIKLDITFDLVEVAKISPDWAYARTTSEGTVTVLANGTKLAEANQELFLLHKDSAGDWKIARYIFSTTNPPR